MTNYNVEEKDLQGERAITGEHVQSSLSVREMLGQRGIKPETLPPAEDIKKLERRVKSQEKKLATQSGKLPGKRTNRGNDNGQKTELAWYNKDEPICMDPRLSLRSSHYCTWRVAYAPEGAFVLLRLNP